MRRAACRSRDDGVALAAPRHRCLDVILLLLLRRIAAAEPPLAGLPIASRQHHRHGLQLRRTQVGQYGAHHLRVVGHVDEHPALGAVLRLQALRHRRTHHRRLVHRLLVVVLRGLRLAVRAVSRVGEEVAEVEDRQPQLRRQRLGDGFLARAGAAQQRQAHRLRGPDGGLEGVQRGDDLRVTNAHDGFLSVIGTSVARGVAAFAAAVFSVAAIVAVVAVGACVGALGLALGLAGITGGLGLAASRAILGLALRVSVDGTFSALGLRVVGCVLQARARTPQP